MARKSKDTEDQERTVEIIRAVDKASNAGGIYKCSWDDYRAVLSDHYKASAPALDAMLRLGYINAEGGFVSVKYLVRI